MNPYALKATGVLPPERGSVNLNPHLCLQTVMIIKGGLRLGFPTNLSKCQLSNTKIRIVRKEYQLALAVDFQFVHLEPTKWRKNEESGSEIDADSCECFAVFSNLGWSFGNVVVDDAVIVGQFPLILGTMSALIVIVVIVLFVRRRCPFSYKSTCSILNEIEAFDILCTR
ncbi:MAG: hypothetical protein ACFFFC_04205 [Candidatus Thorarchaeota archaeon]